jgi:hypothetical protein
MLTRNVTQGHSRIVFELVLLVFFLFGIIELLRELSFGLFLFERDFFLADSYFMCQKYLYRY